MSNLPATLTYFGSIQKIGQILNRSAVPLLQAHELCDPFLPNRFTPLPFSYDQLFEAAVKEVAHYILGVSPPRGQPNHPLQKAILRWRMENRFNDEHEIREALQGLLPAMVEKAYEHAKLAHSNWVNFVSSKKVAAFYEQNQELAMWQLLGHSHRGAAIKFNCSNEEFENCMPADYHKMPASTVSLKQYVEYMMGLLPEVEIDVEKIILRQDYSHRKQKEWRLVVDCNEQKDQWWHFKTNSIRSIYLGALVPEKTCEQLKKHLAKLNPKIRLFKAQAEINSYSLDFTKISEDSCEEEPTES